MNKQEFDKVVQELTEDRKQVAKGKRRDYTKSSENVLQNFYNQADALGLTPMQSLAVHMEKQISAVFNYIKTDGQSESEPIIKRIGDSINYLELLWGLINDGIDKTSVPTEYGEGYETHCTVMTAKFKYEPRLSHVDCQNEKDCKSPNCDCGTGRSLGI